MSQVFSIQYCHSLLIPLGLQVVTDQCHGQLRLCRWRQQHPPKSQLKHLLINMLSYLKDSSPTLLAEPQIHRPMLLRRLCLRVTNITWCSICNIPGTWGSGGLANWTSSPSRIALRIRSTFTTCSM